MPRPVAPGRRYVSGLDGIRAVAVICVIAYHLNVPGAAGGMLGVGVFFTLSGYLITDILLTSWRRHGTLRLGEFWLRRARRLLPALFLVLAAVSVYVALFDVGQLSEVRRQVIASALYVGNWSTIAQHGSYFARFAAPLPLDHLWSLAIEEQFYLVWPWVLLAGIWLLRSRIGLLALTLAMAVLSAWLMGHLYHPGVDPTRAYEGTDTRAFGLLIGAALAMVWGSRATERALSPRSTVLLDAAGLGGLIGIVLLVWRTDVFSRFLYPTGFVLLSVATAALVAAVVNPASRLGPGAGLDAVALDRRALVRDLPVAVADHRAGQPDRDHLPVATGGAGGGGHVARGQPVLAIARGPDSPRRAGPHVATSTRPRQPGAGPRTRARSVRRRGRRPGAGRGRPQRSPPGGLGRFRRGPSGRPPGPGPGAHPRGR